MYKFIVNTAALLFYLGGLGLLIYIATFMPTVKTIAGQVGGVFWSAEVYARDNGITAADFTRMVGPRSAESGTKFATALRDFVVDGGQLAQSANERNVVDAIGPISKLLAPLRPEQVRLASNLVEKQILNGNVDKIFDFAAQDAQSSIVSKVNDVLDGDFVKGLNEVGLWLQRNDTQRMMDDVSNAPLADMVREFTGMLNDMQRYQAANTLAKLTSVLIKVTDALEKS